MALMTATARKMPDTDRAKHLTASAAASAASAMKNALTMLLAAMIRAVMPAGAARCINACSGTEKRPPVTAIPSRSSTIRQKEKVAASSKNDRNSPSAPPLPQVAKNRSSVNNAMPSAAAGASRAEIFPCNSLDAATDPSATPMEKRVRKKVLT